MKKFITLFLALSLLSCNDGDFDVPAFEFTSDVGSCGEYLLYITNSNNTEVLILTLSPSNLGTIEGESAIEILSSSKNVIYRIFDKGIEDSYFCQDIPPSFPNVEKELIAESGIINITTTEISNGYEYSITISDLLFNDVDERIFFENFNFGDFIVNP